MFFKKIITTVILFITLSVSASAEEPKPFDLSAYQGKVVMLDFWASWCIPCKKSFPWLNEMQAAKESQGLVIIGINVDEDSADAESFLQKYEAKFKLEFDPEGQYASFYDIPGMPTSLIFDRDGELVHTHAGFKLSNTDDYEAAIDSTLAQ